MIFKGYNFRKSTTIVQLRNPDRERQNFVMFGKVCPEGTAPANSVLTGYEWPSRAAVRAKYIPLKGHSLTNMAYGEDGRVYLLVDGKCYTAKIKSAK